MKWVCDGRRTWRHICLWYLCSSFSFRLWESSKGKSFMIGSYVIRNNEWCRSEMYINRGLRRMQVWWWRCHGSCGMAVHVLLVRVTFVMGQRCQWLERRSPWKDMWYRSIVSYLKKIMELDHGTCDTLYPDVYINKQNI